MGYTATAVVILYCNPYQPFIIHRAHHVWFHENNSHISKEDKHTPGSLPLQQYTVSIIHDSDPLNLIPCELDLTSTTFSNTNIITYEIDLPPSGKKNCFDLLDDEDFTIPYVTNTTPNSSAGRQLPTKGKRNVCIIAIDG